MLVLVGVHPFHGVDVFGVGLVEVGEGDHDGSTLEERRGGDT